VAALTTPWRRHPFNGIDGWLRADFEGLAGADPPASIGARGPSDPPLYGRYTKIGRICESWKQSEAFSPTGIEPANRSPWPLPSITGESFLVRVFAFSSPGYSPRIPVTLESRGAPVRDSKDYFAARLTTAPCAAVTPFVIFFVALPPAGYV
jgi:hypothetical protein